MSLFSNQNFINQIARQCGLSNLQEEVAAVLQVFVEIETRKLIQQAAKFMRNDCRDLIEFQDVQNGLQNLNHNDITLVCQDDQFTRDGSSYIRRDPVFNPKAFVQQQLKALSLNTFSQPQLKARWIYIDGKIPRINENNKLKAKSEILLNRQKQLGEKDKKFNIIMDQPQSMLTGFELDYFKQTTEMLSQEHENIAKLYKIDYEGNLSNLFPLFLKFFVGTKITELKMAYFLEILKNKYVEKSAQFHLHQVLTYLWAYEGIFSLSVGTRIGKYIKNFGEKYPTLYQLWIEPADKQLFANSELRHTAYCNAMKKIGIELQAGVKISISQELFQWAERDINHQDNSKIVQLFLKTTNQYTSRISCLRNREFVFWIPTLENKKDVYMMLNI